jgi:orotidine 5'-phosphate decarboxylase subfamily 1
MSSPRGLILIAEMSSQGHLMPPDYMRQTLALAEKYPEHVIGFITQHALSADAHWINFTPGVKRATNSDGLGQQYVTPAKAILDNGSDVIIVGRGILHASDPMQEAHYYREEAWRCYQKRITIPRN